MVQYSSRFNAENGAQLAISHRGSVEVPSVQPW